MIIWQGWGILVAVVLVAVMMLEHTVLKWAGITVEAPGTHDLIIFAVSAAILFALDWYISKKTGKIYVDPETGKNVRVGAKHTFFFIPMRYWAVIFVAFGVYRLFTGTEPVEPKIKGELAKPYEYACFSAQSMKEAIAAISASNQPVNIDKLTEESDLSERMVLLEKLECGVYAGKSMPLRLETRASDLVEEQHGAVKWHVARIYIQEIGGESLKFMEQIKPVWFFHVYAGEEDAFIKMEDGKTW
jgi:hypothetical protein